MLRTKQPRSIFLSDRSGQTIMEMVVALTVFTIGFIGIISLLNFSFGMNRFVADNYRANYLAGEGIEIIKSIVMTNAENKFGWKCGLGPGSYELDYRLQAPGPFTTPNCSLPYQYLNPIGFSSTNPLYFHTDSHFYNYDNSPPNVVTAFYRTVTISYEVQNTNGEEDKMIVQSVVRWRDQTGTNEVNLIDYIFNPKPNRP